MDLLLSAVLLRDIKNSIETIRPNEGIREQLDHARRVNIVHRFISVSLIYLLPCIRFHSLSNTISNANPFSTILKGLYSDPNDDMPLIRL